MSGTEAILSPLRFARVTKHPLAPCIFPIVALKKPSKRMVIVLSIVGALTFLYLILGGPAGVIRSYRLYSEVKLLEQEVAETQRVIDSLTIEIDRLKNDTLYIERAARQKLGMARKDETIYKFVEEK